MKHILIAILLAGPSVFAAQNYQPTDDFVVDYISWCKDGQVLNANSKGDIQVLADCESQGLKCVEVQRFAWNRYVVSATCQPAKN